MWLSEKEKSRIIDEFQYVTYKWKVSKLKGCYTANTKESKLKEEVSVGGKRK